MILEKGSLADYKMKFFNPDGSTAEMCGNGIRCFSLFLRDHYDIKASDLSIQTDSGVKNVKLKKDRNFSAVVSMGKPNFSFKEIPAEPSAISSVQKVIKDIDSEYSIILVSVGNPHCVIFFNNTGIREIDLLKYGSKIENLPDFPKKVNIEFCNIVNKRNIDVRVWERGAGETTACGTGACAVAVSAIRNDLANNSVNVNLPGGTLSVKWNIDDEIFLEGEAQEVYKGEIGLAYVKETAKKW
jgi:diaminopimelate epimerase